MSIYQTPLHFGYFLALLFAVLLWLRAWQEERLSDSLLGWAMFMLAMEIQDYTFGFSGINVLWEELNGFPRYFHLAFAPTIYFYLKAQTNRTFRFSRQAYLHYVPYAVYFVVSMAIFLQGRAFVSEWQASPPSQYLNYLLTLSIWVSYAYYFYQSLLLYKAYRVWTETQFSDTVVISFTWVRNFIYLIIAGEVFKWAWTLVDYFLQLDYNQDWWWHLFTVAIIIYVGIKGYSQAQPPKLAFDKLRADEHRADDFQPVGNKIVAEQSVQTPDYSEWKTRLEKLMTEQKLYLEPELSLSDLSLKLNTNATVVSAVINNGYNKNFNDFVNEYRVAEVKQQIASPQNAHLSLLGIAFNCGFNSKATFNRAFKKFSQVSPSTYAAQLQTQN